MGKIVGLTYNLKSDWVVTANDPVDATAELDGIETVEALSKAFESNGHRVLRIGSAQKLLKALAEGLKVDIVFNIAEGFKGRNRESEVPLLLEMHGIPFVGSDALTLGITLDKAIAKKCWISDGVPTGKFFEATPQDDLAKLNTVGYPLIVKTSQEGTSKGITQNSRVTNLEELKREVKKIWDVYHQPALCEQFISGTEFTVAVWGNLTAEAFDVVQYSIGGNTQMGDAFYTYELVTQKSVKNICPAKIDAGLAKKLQTIAIAAYKSVECRDFGRVDFRVDGQGNPYVLEINPLPNLAQGEAFDLSAQARGMNYSQMANGILDFGLKRYALLQGQEALTSR